MAQVGQTTPSGGRTLSISANQGAMRRVTVPVGCTLNHIGVYCWETVAANQNNLKAAIYSTAGVELHNTQVRVAGIPGVGVANVAAVTIPFLGSESLGAGTYDIVVATAGGAGGSEVQVNGENGPGGSPVMMFDAGGIYPDFPANSTGLVDTAATRAWDIYLDYTESAASSGSLAATESGADEMEATGNVGNNGLRLTLRDTDTGALAANLTGLIVSVRQHSDDEATLFKTTSGTTSAGGVLEIASSAVGNVGDYVYVTIELSNHTVVATYRVQAIDLNA